MRSGDLRHRVRVEALGPVRDSHGDVVRDPVTGETDQAWTEVATVWAAVEPLQGREFFASGATQSEVSTRIRMRWRPGFTPAMRVVHGADNYDIEAIIHVKSSRRELQLMCKKVAQA